MVVGFENETKPLNDTELVLVQQFILGFRTKIGRSKRITSSEIEMRFRNKGEKITGSRIRAIVHHIRYNETIIIGNKKYFLISDNSGYWLSCDVEEIRKFSEGLEQRAGSILTIKNAVDKFLNATAAKNYLNENQGDLFNG